MRDHNRARGSACALRGRQPWQGRQRFVRVDSKAGSDWEVEACANRALMYQGSRKSFWLRKGVTVPVLTVGLPPAARTMRHDL